MACFLLVRGALRVRLRRITAEQSKPYPPDGQGKIWWERSDITTHRLSTLADMDVLDADILIAAMTQPPKSLDVPRISAQQPSRSRRERHHPPVSAAATSESRKNRKGRGVCAGHLNGESSFDFILWRGSLDQGKGGVHTDFRNPAAGQSSRRLQLK